MGSRRILPDGREAGEGRRFVGVMRTVFALILGFLVLASTAWALLHARLFPG